MPGRYERFCLSNAIIDPVSICCRLPTAASSVGETFIFTVPLQIFGREEEEVGEAWIDFECTGRESPYSMFHRISLF